jgi:RimJ/RimL family protein N-acetyltransferase
MPQRPPELFKTSRLILRKPVMEDATAVNELYARDPEVTKYLTWQPHRDMEETRSFINRCTRNWKNEESFPWTMIRKSDSQLIGMIEITSIDHAGVSLGFVLARQFWGMGFAPESIRIIIDWALAQSDIYRIWAVCDAENLASKRVLEKSGMEYEGTLRNWLRLPNFGEKPRDCLCYSIIK